MRILVLTGVLLAPSFWANAQDTAKTSIPLDHFYVKRNGPSLLRRILKDVHFGINTGLGKTFFSHQLSGYGIYQAPGGSPEIFSGSTSTRYSNWITNVVEDKTSTVAGSYVDNSSGLGFKGSAISIPLALTVHYAKGRIRVGGGYSYELLELGKFRPTSHADKISTISPKP